MMDYDDEPQKLLPAERTSTTTTEDDFSSTTTTTPRITPGWTVTVILSILLAIISIRRVKRRIE
jgi:hypothetical protein